MKEYSQQDKTLITAAILIKVGLIMVGIALYLSQGLIPTLTVIGIILVVIGVAIIVTAPATF